MEYLKSSKLETKKNMKGNYISQTARSLISTLIKPLDSKLFIKIAARSMNKEAHLFGLLNLK